MNCPYCGGDSRVVDSRPLSDSVRRRRECERCNRRFSTYERYIPVEIKVIKQGGRPAEEFRTEKLLACLERVCRGLSIDQGAVVNLAMSVEAEIVDQSKGQIRSIDIARIVARRLGEVKELAFQRFSINYLDENGGSRLQPVKIQDADSKEEDQEQYLLFEKGDESVGS